MDGVTRKCPRCNEKAYDFKKDLVTDVERMNEISESHHWIFKDSDYTVFYCIACNHAWKVE